MPAKAPKRAIVGEKVGMTQIWDESQRSVAVTVVRVTPVRVVQVKTDESDGYGALQVTYGSRRPASVNKPLAGHYAKARVDPGRALVELRVDDISSYAVGQELGVDIYAAGDKVDVTATSKGRGFAGAMERHNFKGQGASHGNHKHHRAPRLGRCLCDPRPVSSRARAWRGALATTESPRSTSRLSQRTLNATCWF
jgi:large subunit ribosomal protein L3